MRSNNISKFTLRIETEKLQKFRYIAAYDGCSANKALSELIQEKIDDFEQKIDKIPIDWTKEDLRTK